MQLTRITTKAGTYEGTVLNPEDNPVRLLTQQGEVTIPAADIIRSEHFDTKEETR